MERRDIMTCGACGLSWNDAEPTSWTPVPGARCPFEYYHRDDGSQLNADDIPADFPVRPLGLKARYTIGETVRVFHPREFGVIREGRVVKIGRKYLYVDLGAIRGGVYRIAPRYIVH